tara:strand:+ start:237 stop:1571 length:1335 start_codon:yes stop_codon:yes gene_type:complete
MKKKCPDGKYYCYTDKKCKPIPKGFKMVGPAGYLRKENGHSVDDEDTKKNGKSKGANGNGNSSSNSSGSNGSNGSSSGSNGMNEDLRDWFGSGPKGGKGGGGWDRYNTKGERIGKCARGEGEGKPKCLSNEKAAKMSKAERAAAVRRKRRQDPVADRPGKGGKPIMTSNKIKESSSPMVRQILEKIECENEWLLVEKNVPTNPSLWSKFKSQAKAKFDVYPSAYANGWAAKKYKAAGGGWKKAGKSESVETTDEVIQEKKGCVHTHKGEECPVHGKKECPEIVKEAVRVPSQNGNVYLVGFVFKGKYMMMKIFFPDVKRPSRETVQTALDGIYPGCKVQRFDVSPYQPGETMIHVGEENEVAEGAAWTKKSGKNSEGGLNEKGRKSYERENPGSDLKAPSKKVGNPRRASFCARMKGMKKKLTSSKTANDPDSRINKSLRAWNC